jgi:IstB-like ATP binding protein
MDQAAVGNSGEVGPQVDLAVVGRSRRTVAGGYIGKRGSTSLAEPKYQLTIAKLLLAKDIDDFDFTGTRVNKALIRNLASGAFLAEQRNAVLIGGTGKSHLAIAITRVCIRGGARGRFYTILDLVNRLESDARAGWRRVGGSNPREVSVCCAVASMQAQGVAER